MDANGEMIPLTARGMGKPGAAACRSQGKLRTFVKSSEAFAYRAAKGLIGLAAVLIVSQHALAFGQTPSSPLTEEARLEQDFNDPLTTLPQVLIRDSYSPANYGPCTARACPRDVQINQFIIRPLIPRIPPKALFPSEQLIRPTFALVMVPSPRGGVRTEFGDLPLFDIARLPWPDRKRTGLLVGI
jgi:hypothetical protein